MTELANLPMRAAVDFLNRRNIRTKFGGRWFPTQLPERVRRRLGLI
jgi:hypothetical protein